MFEIEINIEDIKSIQNLLHAYPERVDRSAKRALKRAVKYLAQATAKEVVSGYNIRNKTVRKRMWISGATTSNLTAKVTLGKYHIGAEHFNPKQKSVGVEIEEERGVKTILKHYFLFQKTGMLNRIVVKRSTKERFPLEKAYASKTISEMVPESAIDSLLTSAKERLINEFMHQMLGGAEYEGKR